MATEIRRAAVLGAGVMGSGIAAHLAPPGRRVLHDAILGGARRVAAAAGGVLGWKNVNAEEQAVLDELERAFDL